MNVIANTTVISNFASVGRLEVLRQLLTEVFISTDVYGDADSLLLQMIANGYHSPHSTISELPA